MTEADAGRRTWHRAGGARAACRCSGTDRARRARAVAAAALVSLAFAGCGGTPSLPYSDHFSGSCSRWPRQDDEQLKTGCAHGDYHVLVRGARNMQFFTVALRARQVRVEADVRVRGGPAPLEYGLGCFLANHAGYLATLIPGQGDEITGYVPHPQIARAALYGLSDEHHPISVRTRHQLRLDCGPSGIVMRIDGRRTLFAPNIEAFAANTAPQFGHVGFVVLPSASGSDIRFDNFSTTRLPSTTTRAQRALKPFALIRAWERREHFRTNRQAIDGAVEFAQDGCLACHTYLGAGSTNLGAPDLTAEGRKHRGLSWQLGHLRCPACRTPGSPMPPYTGLGPANLHQLAVFLETSKDRVVH